MRAVANSPHAYAFSINFWSIDDVRDGVGHVLRLLEEIDVLVRRTVAGTPEWS